MPRHVDFLVIGGGLAGATAAESLRNEGARGSILILSGEDFLPYNRPPLSKRYLQGKLDRDHLLVLKEADFAKKNIEVRRGTPARSVRPRDNLVVADNEDEIKYGQLLIATGATPQRLDVPGATLAQIHYLRTIGDADAIRESATAARRAVVVGGSFLGLEVAGTLAKLGLGVTIISQGPRLLPSVGSAKVSDCIYRHYAERGVTVLLGDTISAFRGDDRVRDAITQSGHVLPCDMVVVSIGVCPNASFLEGSGIATDDGVVVDRLLRSPSFHNVFAAGDVANFPDPIARTNRRIEHWDNAIKQGRVAAKNMLSGRVAYDEISYFYCDAFDFSFEFLGSPNYQENIIERGSIEDRCGALIYVENDVPNALFTTGRPPSETTAIAALIQNRVNLARVADKIAEPDFALDKVANQTVLVLQGGGALGAFVCGVMRALDERQIYPEVIAGVSIGAFNGAIIAGNPRNATQALESFWNELAVALPDLPDWGPDQPIEGAVSAWYNLTFGSPKFFKPRWLSPIASLDQLPVAWTSFYDPSPVKELLSRYIDFSSLRRSPVRLLMSAVNVETAELSVFDSYSDAITPDHILASGSLPPGFPWTTIGSKHYWDGGMISNSPLEQVMDRCGIAGKRIVIVDLYANDRALPRNMMEVMARRDEIIYAERVRKGVETHNLVRDFHALINEMLTFMEPDAVAQVKQRPRFSELMGNMDPASITRIVRQGAAGEPSSRDFNFSAAAIEKNKKEGYERAVAALLAEQEIRSDCAGPAIENRMES